VSVDAAKHSRRPVDIRSKLKSLEGWSLFAPPSSVPPAEEMRVLGKGRSLERADSQDSQELMSEGSCDIPPDCEMLKDPDEAYAAGGSTSFRYPPHDSSSSFNQLSAAAMSPATSTLLSMSLHSNKGTPTRDAGDGGGKDKDMESKVEAPMGMSGLRAAHRQAAAPNAPSSSVPNSHVRAMLKPRNHLGNQYMHRIGYAAVRVGASCFVWLPSR
jgi:hypothetical protein